MRILEDLIIPHYKVTKNHNLYILTELILKHYWEYSNVNDCTAQTNSEENN